jgi:hypothetical protein
MGGVAEHGGSAGSVLESNEIHTNDGRRVGIAGEGSKATLSNNTTHANKMGGVALKEDSASPAQIQMGSGGEGSLRS